MYPKLRFKGFDDAWEQRKLGEITGKVIGGGTPKTCVSEYWDGDIPWIQSSNVQENEMFDFDIPKSITQEGLEKSAAKLVPENSIAVVTHVGVGKLVFVPFSYTTSQDFTSLSELKTDAQFTCYSLYQRIKNDLHIVQGSAIKGITKDDLLSKEIMVPEIQEQRKIGNYFRKLDNLITLHQRQCEALKKQKQFFLQNMFPKEGESVPRIRFNGFTEPWEQRKLSDIGNIITGSTPSTKDKNNYNGDFLFVSPADIQGNRFVEKTITTLSELGFKKGRILAPKSTLFVSIGSTIGKVAQIRDFAVTNQQINSIEPFKDIDPDFVFSLMQKESPSIRCLSATQAVPILNKTTFSNVEVSIASNINEQYRIGELFIKLDSTITLHQR